MRRLMLLRHAKTERDAPSGRDHDRQLDERGHSDAADIGEFIRHHPPLPDAVLVSPAVRAHQTWEIVRQALRGAGEEPRVELVAELYGAEPMQLLHIIRDETAHDPHVLMVVGHNPGLHELALALEGGGEAAARKALAGNLPTSGLAIFDFAIKSWDDVAFRRGQLKLFVSPKLLKQSS